ncbi:glycosyltransferase family protein [Albibacterium indicum]|uniref:glycosyltransferase family protein n=1 Tax=Albibacterium indicum TaxID=2292082 RepID=UPI000E49189D|nr:glycosyltransferase family protein [Pedobacter indicus]
MNVLYAIQGTGNGHLCRAMDIVPSLRKHANVDILLSGTQADINLPFDIKYRLNGLSFIFGKHGGVDLWKTFVHSKFRLFIKEVNACPVQDYDLVINDFEPVSSWACNLKEKFCIALSHQAAAVDHSAPNTEEIDRLGKFILKHYAPHDEAYGFHFQSYANNIFTPIIRQQVREKKRTNKGHYTVYLPSYDDEALLRYLSRFPDVKWDVFSKHNKRKFTSNNISFQPIDNTLFIESMASSEGILCGAGFETPAEALFLKKKLLVIPMKNQYEQHLNAAALKDLGVPVVRNIKPENDVQIRDWLESNRIVDVDYKDEVDDIIYAILERHANNIYS